MSLLRYRAGRRALRRLRASGLDAASIRVLAGPASGPRWLVLVGIDRALMTLDAPTAGARRLLVGASAGAWRMLALACRDPELAHRTLLDGYVQQVFRRGDTPVAVSGCYERLLRDVVPDEELEAIVEHPRFDVALHVTRARGFGAWRVRGAQAAALLGGAALHALSRGAVGLLFRRVLLHSRPERLTVPFHGTLLPLARNNLRQAALASGTVPVYMEPVRGIPGAPPGAYLDGGITDYHLRQSYAAADDGITLLTHFQQRVLPAWFDRYRSRRPPNDGVLDDVLQIFPSPEFVAGLPGGRLPDRDDFIRFVDAPEERIRRWTDVALRGEQLGEALIDDLRGGRVPDLVEPI